MTGPGSQLAGLAATELAAQYRERALSPVEVVDALLERIAGLDSVLNAWVTVAEGLARGAAQASSERYRHGEPRGPLDGVPIALKDNCDVRGLATTCGSRILRDHMPRRDAEVVTRLQAAGAIILGKTNMLEFAYGNVHPDVGQCNNPWNPERTAGGSSSGSAAAVAAGMVPIALGTDTGGSIRIPAAYCGIVGLKPTFGRVSHAGVFPLSWSIDHVGPLGRTVGDVASLFDLIDSAPNPGRERADGRSSSLRGLRAGVVRQHVGGVRAGVRAAFDRSLNALAGAGVDLEEVSLPSWEHAEAAHFLVLAPEASAIHRDWIRSRPQDYAEDTLRQLQLGALIPGDTHLRAQRLRTWIARETAAVLGRVEVLLSPTVGFVAPERDPALGSELGAEEGLRTGPHCLIGLPAISIPCGLAEDHLPTALQLAGRWGRDRTLLEVAARCREALGPETGIPQIVGSA
ncbi:MAG TPA: amidase [Verrucomicrobiae bacterium]|nr:amidase [Verrucomicrobiae bacterium]